MTKIMARIRIADNSPKTPKYFSVHTHSRYSAQDALPSVKDIVTRAAELGYQGLGLTDHGNMAGSIELYMECQKVGIKPFPGSEMYLVLDRSDKKAKRYHMCLLAYTSQGYRNLVKISTDSHKNFHNKPLVDMSDLARYHDLGWSEGIALTTGCFFGLVITRLINDGYEAAKQVVASYASWFDTYVEIQDHCIEHDEMDEDEIAENLARIAEELDLPVIVTQDSHYVHADDKPVHETLKRLVSFGTDADEAVFPGDGFHLVDDAWMERHHSEAIYNRGLAGLELLLSRHDLRIPEADEYNYRVPSISDDPIGDLRKRCTAALLRRGLLQDKYLDRLAEEIEVVEASRMGNYLLLVAQVTDWMRANNIFFQTRGSAAGSLICWMLGISNIDPIKWGARFDRFLSKDRTKPPDIDLDVENIYRQKVMEMLAERYAVGQMCTWSVLGLNADEQGKGSLKVKYFGKMRAYAKAKGVELPALTWETVPAEDKKMLYTLSDHEALANAGVHPCGMVLVNSRTELEEMVPMMWVASSKTMVTQYDGPVIESIGLIKLDLLGSKTMSVLRIACENIGISTDDLDKIPFNSSKAYQMIAKGDTDGFFQMEGYTTQRGCRDMKPNKISEVIDVMALFRPGVMNSGATQSYIDRKFGRQRIPERHEIIDKGTKSTRGILLYQDQIIAILRDLGLSPDDLTAFLKAVKASNKNVEKAKKDIDHYMPIIEGLCKERGMSDEDFAWMQEAFVAFAEYSFNIAHATVYGITAYRCAYLAIHYGVQFHAALLAVASGTDKEAQYITATRKRGYRIKRPDINSSGLVYTVDKSGKSIRKGLLSVPGVGLGMAPDIVASQPYSDWDDFATKMIGTKVTGIKPFKPGETSEAELVGAVAKLHAAGAFEDSIGSLPLGNGKVKKVIKLLPDPEEHEEPESADDDYLEEEPVEESGVTITININGRTHRLVEETA